MNKKEKELLEIKNRVKIIHNKMHSPLHELAFNKASNPTEETNEKYNILLDALFELIDIYV